MSSSHRLFKRFELLAFGKSDGRDGGDEVSTVLRWAEEEAVAYPG